jgi:selenide,water dikinase
MPRVADDRVLIDYRTSDDAGVYRIGGEEALVQTVDFFTPIVDDPYTYGQIAAANALSDVYAMGGRPITALAVAAFPAKGFPAADIEAIFKGGHAKLVEAGVALLGGHTVQDQEVKFGYAVTGLVHVERVWSNAGARPGDVLILTKPLGTGIVTTAIKFGRAPDLVVNAALQAMTTLNRDAAAVLMALPIGCVHACTDVTGFGMVGHSTELATASGVTVCLDVDRVPIIDGAAALANRNRPGGIGTNRQYFGPGVDERSGLDDNLRALVYDPQTSGGLLVAVDAETVEAAMRELKAAGVQAARVGEVIASRSGVRVVIR